MPEGRSSARSQAAQSSQPGAIELTMDAAGGISERAAGGVLGLTEEVVMVLGARLNASGRC